MRLWWLAAALAAGWRHDGSGVVEAAPPADWQTGWSTSLAPGGHGSPVVAKGVVVVTQEPHTLVGLDADTGRVLWSHAHPVLDALPAALAEPLAPRLAKAGALEAELAEVRTRRSRLLRDVRRAGSTVTPAQIDAVALEVSGLESSLAALAPYREVDGDTIGFAAATPATDGEAVYALFGNGVLVARGLDGALRWQLWLGRTPREKWGYTGGDGASPQLHGDTLVVPWGELRGIDPRTGEVRWVGPSYPHFGTPALTTVAGNPVAITPAGEVVDTEDGRVLGTGLPRLFYLAPTALGNEVWTLGGDGDADSSAPNQATRWTLSDGGATQTRVWTTSLESRDRFYTTPVVAGGYLFAVTRRQDLHVLDASTGALVHRGILEGLTGEILSNLTVAGEHLYITTDQGVVAQVQTTEPFGVVRTHAFEPSLSTPWFEGARVYQRGRSHVRCGGCR